MSRVGEWYAAGLASLRDDMHERARMAKLRAKRLDARYQGDELDIFVKALGDAAAQLDGACDTLKKLREPARLGAGGEEDGHE